MTKWAQRHTHTHPPTENIHIHWWPLRTIALDFKGFQKCNTIDDFWKHYAESEKLDFKSHILFDLIYMISGKRQDDMNKNQIRACQELEGQELTTMRNRGTIWSDENISWLWVVVTWLCSKKSTKRSEFCCVQIVPSFKKQAKAALLRKHCLTTLCSSWGLT